MYQYQIRSKCTILSQKVENMTRVAHQKFWVSPRDARKILHMGRKVTKHGIACLARHKWSEWPFSINRYCLQDKWDMSDNITGGQIALSQPSSVTNNSHYLQLPTNGGAEHSQPHKCRLAPTVIYTNQESASELYTKFSIFYRFCSQICKQCLQTASASQPGHHLWILLGEFCPTVSMCYSPKWIFLAPLQQMKSSVKNFKTHEM